MNPEVQQDLRNILKTSAGQNVLWYLLTLCEPFNSPFCQTGRADTDYMCGRQSVGLDLIRCLEAADPTAFPRLMLNNLEKTNVNRPTDTPDE